MINPKIIQTINCKFVIVMKKIILPILLLFISLSQASAQTSVSKQWYVADAKIACSYNGTVTSCLKIKEHKDSSWRDFPFEIEGFIFEPGVETLIEVTETKILYPEDNGPKNTYKLVKVLESRNTVLTDRRLLSVGRWKIINIEYKRSVLPSKKAGAYLDFNIDSNKLNGFAGCNSFGGNTQIENGSLGFGIFNASMMSCPNDEIERQIKEAMIGRAAFYVRNNILFVVCENQTILHLRCEKKLDSMIAVINAPAVPQDDNNYTFMKDGNCAVRLDYVKQANKQVMMFKKGTMTVEQKKVMKYRLVNMFPENTITELHILKKVDKVSGMNYAVVKFKDGSQMTVLMQHVL